MMQDRNDQDSADTWYPHLCTIPTFQILTKPYCLIALLPYCPIAPLPYHTGYTPGASRPVRSSNPHMRFRH